MGLLAPINSCFFSILFFLSKLVDRNHVLQKIIRNVPLERKLSIVKRLTTFPKGNQQARCYGVKWELDLSDLLQREIYYKCYDMKKRTALLRYIKPNQVCIDVGSNVGFYALQMAKKMRGQGYVYSMEADPEVFKLHFRNCQLNEFGKIIELENKALSNKEGVQKFYRHTKYCSGYGSLTFYPHIHDSEIEISTVTLDEFLKTKKITKVDFIKVDIEGNEFEFLEGAEKSLKEKYLKKIYIEFNGILLAQKGYSFLEFFDLFAQYGYSPVDINLHLVEKMKKNKISAANTCGDFLFAPTSF